VTSKMVKMEKLKKLKKIEMLCDYCGKSFVTGTPHANCLEAEDVPQLPILPLSTVRMTRAESALATMTPEKLKEIMSCGARYSESTLKKHSWVLGMYTGFTTAYGYATWPLTPTIASGFIRYLGFLPKSKYAVSRIEDVIIPSLKLMNIEKIGLGLELGEPTSKPKAMRQIYF
jgi:hypothetical protein